MNPHIEVSYIKIEESTEQTKRSKRRSKFMAQHCLEMPREVRWCRLLNPTSPVSICAHLEVLETWCSCMLLSWEYVITTMYPNILVFRYLHRWLRLLLRSLREHSVSKTRNVRCKQGINHYSFLVVNSILFEVLENIHYDKLDIIWHRRFYHDHNNSDPYLIRYKPEVFDQPIGTTYLGFFQSFKYFSDPEVIAAIKDIFYPHHEIREAVNSFLMTIDSQVAAKSMICVAYPRKVSLFLRHHHFISPWAVSINYYTRALNSLLKSLDSIVNIVLVPVGHTMVR